MSHLILTLLLAIVTTSYARNINLSSFSSEGRIVGGEFTTIEEYPYLVSLEILGEHWCGGSLIKHNIVLTAAHCLQNSYLLQFYSVRAGSTIKEEGGHVVQISDVCNHPKYHGPYDLDYDVSVLKLDRPFDLNSAIQLIRLQNPDEEVQVGTVANVTGWGTLEWKGRVSKYLQKLEVPKLDQKLCQQQYLSIFNITDRMTCYGYSEGEKDACQKDSGSPLVVNRRQIGILSYGDECTSPNKPGIYTRVENKEIYNHISSCLEKFA